jgi:hypothetical protein
MATTNLKYEIKFRQKQSAKKEFENWSNTDFINCILELRQELELKNQQEADLINEKEHLQKTIETTAESNYVQQWSFPTKIVFLLHLKNRPLISSEIDELLHKLDKTYKKFKTPKKTLAGILTRTSNSKRIIKIKQAGIRDLQFVLPKWLNKEGVLIDNFKKL